MAKEIIVKRKPRPPIKLQERVSESEVYPKSSTGFLGQPEATVPEEGESEGLRKKITPDVSEPGELAKRLAKTFKNIGQIGKKPQDFVIPPGSAEFQESIEKTSKRAIAKKTEAGREAAGFFEQVGKVSERATRQREAKEGVSEFFEGMEQEAPARSVSKVAGEVVPKIAQYTVKPFTKWFGGAVAESLKAKTLETLALVIVAIILGAFGFIFAAIGVVFFIAFLYLPGEAEILARAREQGRNLPVNQLIDILDEIQLTLADMKATKDKREKAELRGKLKDLLEKRKYIIKKAVDSGVSPQQLKDIAEISKTFPAEAGE